LSGSSGILCGLPNMLRTLSSGKLLKPSIFRRMFPGCRSTCQFLERELVRLTYLRVRCQTGEAMSRLEQSDVRLSVQLMAPVLYSEGC
jgi:hypothetical protein